MKSINSNILRALADVFKQKNQFVFLDTSMPGGADTRSLLFCDPLERLLFSGGDEQEFLRQVQGRLDSGMFVAGWFAYEFGALFEPRLRRRLTREEDKGAILADLGVYSRYYSFDHTTGKTDFPVTQKQGQRAGEDATYTMRNLRTSQSEKEYISALRKVLAYIESGDTYQVNYTLKLGFDFEGDYELFYRTLRRNQSVRYGAYIRNGEQRIMSFSPELFFRRNGGFIVTRPMKGTVHRGKTCAEDTELRNFLRTDLKNRSENVMIVDLLRNDLGRVIHQLRGGEVSVASMFDVETYETLLQMTSTVVGTSSVTAMNDLGIAELFRAVFPCGSVTGAPKIRTMEIIDELEKTRRGVYTGTIGYMAPGREAVFNVPIRTVVLERGTGEMGIGSGIVHDSDPDNEWRECLLKGRFLTHPVEPFKLIETFLWQPGVGYLFLEGHLGRLWQSADYFLFSCCCREIRERLAEFAASFPREPRRVRMLLEKDGSLSLEQAPASVPQQMVLPTMPAVSSSLPKVGLSKQATDSTSKWLYHKTTRRSLYERAHARARSEKLFDYLFYNERGKITEGAISNIVAYLDGGYCTPPLSDGLLGGVMRAELLRQGPAVLERSLTPADLLRAEAIFCCNSVRGVVQVALTTDITVSSRPVRG